MLHRIRTTDLIQGKREKREPDITGNESVVSIVRPSCMYAARACSAMLCGGSAAQEQAPWQRCPLTPHAWKRQLSRELRLVAAIELVHVEDSAGILTMAVHLVWSTVTPSNGASGFFRDTTSRIQLHSEPATAHTTLPNPTAPHPVLDHTLKCTHRLGI